MVDHTATVTVDWAGLLAPAKLDVPDPSVIAEVHAVEWSDMDGDCVVEVRVVLAEQIGINDLTWELLGPITRSISTVVLEQGVGYPYVRYFTTADWKAMSDAGRANDDDA